MQLFEAYLGAATTGQIGAQHVLNAEYFKRIDALNYTMMHDDGQQVDPLAVDDPARRGRHRHPKEVHRHDGGCLGMAHRIGQAVVRVGPAEGDDDPL